MYQSLKRIDRSQPSLFTHAKEKESEASAKHAGVGVGFTSEASKKNIYIGPHRPPTKSSLPFNAGVQLSCDSIRAFNDRIKIQENRGL